MKPRIDLEIKINGVTVHIENEVMVEDGNRVTIDIPLTIKLETRDKKEIDTRVTVT